MSLFPQILDEEWAELDGQEQIETLLKTRLKAMKNERAEVELLLETARRSEQAGPDAKAEALIDWIYQLRQQESDPDLKILIFTEFVPTQQMLSEFLAGRGFSVACLNGSLDQEGRGQVQLQFAGTTEVLVSTEAGGEGLNLQFCHAVVNYDMPWNPMRIEQRIGRVDRIGQKHIVRALIWCWKAQWSIVSERCWNRSLRSSWKSLEQTRRATCWILRRSLTNCTWNRCSIQNRFRSAWSRRWSGCDSRRRRLGRSITLLGAGTPLDPNIAQQMLEHPLPHWVERMTVSYLNSHGGKAERRGRVWDLTWPASLNAGVCEAWRSTTGMPMTCPVLSTSGWKIHAFVDWRNDCRFSFPAKPLRGSGWRTSPMKSAGTGRSGEFG